MERQCDTLQEVQGAREHAHLPPALDGQDRWLRELSRNAKGELVAHFDGADEPAVDVRIARCFPWSLPESLISVRDKDGKELVLLETLEHLPQSTRELIEGELRDKLFAPRINRILSHEDRFGIVTIEADTDRGEVKFQLRHRDDVRVLSATRCVFQDVDGNIYEVRDLRKLDPASQRFVTNFM